MPEFVSVQICPVNQPFTSFTMLYLYLKFIPFQDFLPKSQSYSKFLSFETSLKKRGVIINDIISPPPLTWSSALSQTPLLLQCLPKASCLLPDLPLGLEVPLKVSCAPDNSFSWGPGRGGGEWGGSFLPVWPAFLTSWEFWYINLLHLNG